MILVKHTYSIQILTLFFPILTLNKYYYFYPVEILNLNVLFSSTVSKLCFA